MNKIIVFIVVISLIGCNQVTNRVIIDKKTGKQMLVGLTDRTAFEKPEFSEWFNDVYSNYEPDEFIIEQINELNDSIKIQIFMGTWCSDSRREVPRFLKILDLMKFDQSKLQIVNLDRKKASPTHEEKNRNIEFVPTFIIYKYSTEIGRIIEFPIITLESDLFNLLLESNI